MNTYRKKLLPLLGLAALLTSAPVRANEHEEHHQESNTHAVPAAQYPVGANLTFYIDAAYTYWVPYQEGMNIAVSVNPDPTGNIVRPRMTGTSGFKVGLGANTHHDGWRAGLEYTWFYYNPNMRDNKVNNERYRCLFDDAPADDIDAIRSRFETQFNRINGTVDRSFFVGHNVTMRPWMGLVGAWDTQRLEFDIDKNGNQFPTPDSFRLKQSWWGIGPYAGMEGTYYLMKEVGLYLSMGGAILLANHENHHVQTADDGTTITTEWNGNNNFNSVEPMVENTLGLCWDGMWPDWGLKIFLQWEMQTYFSHNGFLPQDVTRYQTRGNYSMQGLTTGMRISF